MDKITTILFDMDGVLISAKEWHYSALNKALVDFGYDPIDRHDHIEIFDGLPTRKKLAILGEKQGIPQEQIEDINSLKQQYTREIAEKLCYPIPHHIKALSQLKKRGYKMALCSNSVRKSVDTMMTKAKLMPYLSFCLSNEDVSNPKPSPEIYLTAMKKFNVGAGETLVLEDNKNGVKAALDAGAHLLHIKEVDEVTYENIANRIREIEIDGT